MLRGWKSASCNGFPAPSGATGDDLIEVRGNLLAKKNIPMLSNQRLRSIPLINPPVSLNPTTNGFPFSSTSSISFTFSCQSAINLWVQHRIREINISTMHIDFAQIAPTKL